MVGIAQPDYVYQEVVSSDWQDVWDSRCVRRPSPLYLSD